MNVLFTEISYLKMIKSKCLSKILQFMSTLSLNTFLNSLESGIIRLVKIKIANLLKK